MEHDDAASPRVGQRPAVASTAIPRMNGLPENPYDGQVVYDETDAKSYIYAKDTDEWKVFGGGVEFYAQPDPPSTAGYGAFWLDTAP